MLSVANRYGYASTGGMTDLIGIDCYPYSITPVLLNHQFLAL